MEQVTGPEINSLTREARRVNLSSQAWTINPITAEMAIFTLTAGAAPVVNLASWTDVV